MCHLFGAHAAEKISTKQLSALSSIFMISWILSLTCTFGRLGGHVIWMCLPDVSKPPRFQGGFTVFSQLYGSNSRQQNTTLLRFSTKHLQQCKPQHCHVSAFTVHIGINTVNEAWLDDIQPPYFTLFNYLKLIWRITRSSQINSYQLISNPLNVSLDSKFMIFISYHLITPLIVHKLTW